MSNGTTSIISLKFSGPSSFLLLQKCSIPTWPSCHQTFSKCCMNKQDPQDFQTSRRLRPQPTNSQTQMKSAPNASRDEILPIGKPSLLITDPHQGWAAARSPLHCKRDVFTLLAAPVSFNFCIPTSADVPCHSGGYITEKKDGVEFKFSLEYQAS